jgi:peptidoglycan hydrolase CwlO-like protein
MTIEDQEITQNRYPEASDFSQTLETLQSQLPAILEDFKKYYVFYNKTPDYPEYQQLFENIKSNLNSINSDLFTLSNDVQGNIDSLNKDLTDLNSQIEREKEKNRKLKLDLGIVENKNNAATEMIYDYKKMYESGYLRNWGLFLSILVVGVAVSKLYKGSNSNLNK